MASLVIWHFLSAVAAVASQRAPPRSREHQNTATPCGRASGLCRVIGTGDNGISVNVPSSSSTAST